MHLEGPSIPSRAPRLGELDQAVCNDADLDPDYCSWHLARSSCRYGGTLPSFLGTHSPHERCRR